MEDTNLQQEALEFGVSGEIPGSMAKATPSDTQPWREYLDDVLEILAKVPDYVGQFFADYKQPLVTLGLFLAAIITVKITLAILDALNDIPLLAPLLELVGLGYTAWFIWRYLWKASNRQELTTEFEALKKQILGDKA
jgi:hypothetical protein